MKFSELAVLLPCHSLEDFPIYHAGQEADQLLAAWCVLWHPLLLASSGNLPTWHRIDVLPEAGPGLYTLAAFYGDRLAHDWADRTRAAGGNVILAMDRSTTLEQILRALEPGSFRVDAELTADFLALGFCKLQVELLTRQMRYSMYLDESQFASETLAAAHAASEGNEAEARSHLAHSFESLNEARKHFYPVEFYLLDITLAAENTLGAGLERELKTTHPKNLVAPLDTVSKIAGDAQSWPAVLQAVEAGTLGLIGGEPTELELPLLPIESVLASLSAGVSRYESLIGWRPRVFGRRRAGLWPALPQLLSKLGYQGALHFTLDDGRFPLASQAKTRWEGGDSSVVDVFGRVPADAAQSETFLGLSRKIADSMDNDHVATLALAHWPGATSPWYDDLRRIAGHSPVLGKFILLDEYFSQTDMPGRLSKFAPDEYRTPYLKQAVIRAQPDPISNCVRAHIEEARRLTWRSLEMMLAAVRGVAAPNVADRELTVSDKALSDLAGRLAGVLSGGQADGEKLRTLVLNPLSGARNIAGRANAPTAGAASASPSGQLQVVNVPAMGFAWIDPQIATSGKPRQPIANENVLRNEFCEVTVGRSTGGIQSVFSFSRRGNQLSQQIALRENAAQADTFDWAAASEPRYTAMQADAVETTVSTPAVGEITSRGQLIHSDGQPAGRFRQTTRLWAGSPVVEIEIELSDLIELRADPWNSYYAARFAWPDPTAELYRGVSMGRHRTELARFEAPEYITIENESGTAQILTGGLPYHRRSDDRMLDALLVVRGERARCFRMAVALDLPHAAAAAQALLAPEVSIATAAAAPKLASGWFFHVAARHVVVTDWSPVLDDAEESATLAERPVRGFRARLLETEGRPGRVALRAPRALQHARQMDYLGQTLLEVPVEDDKIWLDFAAHEWIAVEAIWS
jgi:alpha-mannosidase